MSTCQISIKGKIKFRRKKDYNMKLTMKNSQNWHHIIYKFLKLIKNWTFQIQ